MERHWRHKLLVSAVLLPLLAIFASGVRSVLADAPATVPSKEETPQEALARMDDGHLATLTFEQILQMYNATNDSEKEMANLMAAQEVATLKLEESAKKQWGDAAKKAVARVCLDNTPEDDARAQWTISGDHAAAQFTVEGMAPIYLIRVGEDWKVDVAAYAAALGNQVPAGLRFMKAETAVLERASDGIGKGSFGSVDELTKYLKDEMDKLNAGN